MADVQGVAFPDVNPASRREWAIRQLEERYGMDTSFLREHAGPQVATPGQPRAAPPAAPKAVYEGTRAAFPGGMSSDQAPVLSFGQAATRGLTAGKLFWDYLANGLNRLTGFDDTATREIMDATARRYAELPQEKQLTAATDLAYERGKGSVFGETAGTIMALPGAIYEQANPIKVVRNFLTEQIIPSLPGFLMGAGMGAAGARVVVNKAALEAARKAGTAEAAKSILRTGGRAEVATAGAFGNSLAVVVQGLGTNYAEGLQKYGDAAQAREYALDKTTAEVPWNAVAGLMLGFRMGPGAIGNILGQATAQGTGGALGARSAALAVGETPNPKEQALEFAGEFLGVPIEMAMMGGQQSGAMDLLNTPVTTPATTPVDIPLTPGPTPVDMDPTAGRRPLDYDIGGVRGPTLVDYDVTERMGRRGVQGVDLGPPNFEDQTRRDMAAEGLANQRAQLAAQDQQAAAQRFQAEVNASRFKASRGELLSQAEAAQLREVGVQPPYEPQGGVIAQPGVAPAPAAQGNIIVPEKSRARPAAKAPTSKLTKSELLSSLVNTARKQGASSPVSKAGESKRKWLGKILDAKDPLAAIRSTFANGMHEQAQLLDAWYSDLTGRTIEGDDNAQPGPEQVEVRPLPEERKPAKASAQRKDGKGEGQAGLLSKPVNSELTPTKKPTVVEKVKAKVAAKKAETVEELIDRKLAAWSPEPQIAAAPKETVAKRASDFSRTGNYEVEVNGETRRVYRDPESGWWYEDAPGHHTENFLGFTKKDALERIKTKKKTAAPKLAEKKPTVAEKVKVKVAEKKKDALSEKEKRVIDDLDTAFARGEISGDQAEKHKTAITKRYRDAVPRAVDAMNEATVRKEQDKQIASSQPELAKKLRRAAAAGDISDAQLKDAMEGLRDGDSESAESLLRALDEAAAPVARRNEKEDTTPEDEGESEPPKLKEEGVTAQPEKKADRPEDEAAFGGKATKTAGTLLPEFVRLALGKGNLSAGLAFIAARHDIPYYRALAKRLMELRLKTTVAVGVNKDSAATYRASEDQIRFRDYEWMSDRILLHETVHAATLMAWNTRGRAVTATQKAAVYRLNVAFELANQSWEKKFGKEAQKHYGLTSVAEFIAEAFTSPDFQAFLNGVTFPSSDKTIWASFIDIVRKLLGLAPNSLLEEVMDAGALTFSSSRAPVAGYGGSPDGDGSVANFGYSEAANASIANMTKALQSKTLLARLKSGAVKVRPAMLSSMTLRQLVDVYSSTINGLKEYAANVHKMDAKVNEVATAADKIAVAWRDLKDADALGEVMLLATTQKIHPDKPLAEQAWLGDDKAAPQNYAALQAKYTALSPAAKKAYAEATEFFEERWNRTRDLIFDNIKAVIEDKVDQDREMAAARKQLGQLQGPYFPLVRFGKHLLVAYKADDMDGTRTVEAFESAYERDQAAKEYAQQGYEVKRREGKDFNTDLDIVPSKFVKKLNEAIDVKFKDNPAEAKDWKRSINQLYLQTLPDASGAKRMLHRRGVKGWSTDARRAFSSAAFHSAFYEARLEYLRPLREQIVSINEAKRTLQDSTVDQVVNQVEKRHAAAMTHVDTPLVDFMGNVNYIWYLGFTPSFFVLNLLQNPMVAMPMMASRHGYGASGRELARAAAEVARVRIKAFKDGGWRSELDTKAVTSKVDEQAMLEALMKEQLIDMTQSHDLGAVAAGRSERAANFMYWATFAPHHTEVFNRITAALAAYRLARHGKSRLSPQEATDYAREVVSGAHFDYSNSNKPYFMQPAFFRPAKVVFALKQYQQHMIYSLIRNASVALKGASAAERSQARKALVGIFGMHILAAGAMGAPFAALAFGLANVAYALAGDDDEPWDAETAFRNFLAEAFGQEAGEFLAKGAVRAAGIDVSDRIGLGDLGLLWRWQEGPDAGRAAWNEVAVGLLGPAAAIPGGLFEMQKQFSLGNYRRGWEAASPKFAKDAIRATRFASEGLTTQKGKEVKGADEFAVTDLLWQAAGFRPSAVSEVQAGRGAVEDARQHITNRRDYLVRMMSLARMHRDDDATEEYAGMIKAFNKKNPEVKITPATILKSLRESRRVEKQMSDQGIRVEPKFKRLATYGAFANSD